MNEKPKKTQELPPVSKRRAIIAVSVIGVLVIALILIGFITSLMSDDNVSGVQKDKYQAVFLTNGQVYFGDINAIYIDEIHLENVYYLQVDQGETAEDAAENLEDSGADVNLIKLGNELHGPTDEMFISRQQVLFWENLKEDSKVSEAIDEFNSNK